MKKLIPILLLLVWNQMVWAEKPQYRVVVDGLACPFCAYGIEKQLQKLDGVKAVETDIKQGHLMVRMQDGETLLKAQAEQAVKKAGFSLRSFQQVEEEKP